ncbi:MAG TPA: alpha/beta hydrolase [Edaphobacter sp.]|nr:alpha/beta hydrolase [Edaphobacter sp.]
MRQKLSNRAKTKQVGEEALKHRRREHRRVQLKCFVLWVFALGMLARCTVWAQSIAGDWQGTLDGPQKLRAVLKVSAAADGRLSAQFFSVDQAPEAMSVESLTLSASAVTFTIPSVRGSYEGKLSLDGAAITGVWTQGVPHPLNFVRATKETAWTLDQSPHTTSLITVEPGVKLEVLDWGGAGRPVVLLAGLGNSAHGFDRFAPKLTTKYHVYGISRRGYGGSDSPVPAGDNYLADRLGDDVLAVLDALTLTHPVLLGHSIAGEELSSIGSRHPERVAGLVYLDAGYSYAFYDRARPDFQMDILELRRKLSAIVNAISPQEQKKLIAEIAKELPLFEKDVQARQKELAARPDMSATDIAKVKKQMESRQAISGRAVFSGMQPYTDIRCPVLAIFAVPHQRGSKRDPDADAKDIAEVEPQVGAFEKGIPQAKVVRIAHANHYVFTSNEADVIREIDGFIAGLK